MQTQSIIEQADGQTTPDGGARELRPRIRGMWAAVAPAWGEHAEYLDTRHAESTAEMLAAVAPKPGEHVLELACGVGGAGLAAAELVRPGGAVVMSDVVGEMTAIAATRAAERGLEHVSTCVLDLERIDQPGASYDIVLCREGLMFVPDPAAAARELCRVLRPGGRLALTVWGPRAANPWLALIFEAVGARLGRPVPPPGVPGPFSLEDAGGLAALLRDGGLSNVVVREMAAPMRSGSFEDWWSKTSSLAGPLAQILAAMPAPSIQALLADLRERTAPFRRADGGLEFPGVTLLTTARR
jgi:SAM-dependent methyltransferase